MDMKKLMGKKDKEEPNKEHIEAKMKVLQDLRDMMSHMMGDGMKKNHEELRRVAVMAQDKQGLEHGLDKAKEIVEGMPEGQEESPEHEASESPEEEMSEHQMSDEDIDKEIERLQMMKRMK